MNTAPPPGLPRASHTLQSSSSFGAERITPETPASNSLWVNRSSDVFSSPHPWQHMTRTIAHYERLEQIGLGTYGQVYRAICKDTGRMVAMKKMRIMSTAGGKNGPVATGMPLQLIREIKILKQLQHPNLLQMIEVVTSKGVEHLDPEDPIPPSSSSEKNKTETNEDAENDESYKAAMARERFKGNLFLVLEYMTHDLTGLMDVAYQFTPVQMKCIMSQLFQALKFMHEHKYVHRDIKSSNILLDSYFRLKLADFGLARSLEPPLLDQMESSSTTISSSYSNTQQDLTNKVITLWYRPPEILLGTVRYGCAVDVWSAGCILAELWTGKPLAAGKTELDQLKLLADLTGTPDNETWEYLMSLKKTRSLLPTITSTATEWSGSGQRPSKLQEKYGPPKSSKKGNRQIPESALNLLEKLLEWDPRKRLTAANALQNRYFWTQPVAPEDPAELGRIDVAVDGHFHEFQTKQKRKQAKTHAEQVREQALRDGATAEAASELFDETYKGIMKQIAQKGISDALEEKSVPMDVELDGNKMTDIHEGTKNDLTRKEEGRSRHGGSKDEKRDHRKDSDRRRDRKHSRGDGSLEEEEQYRRDKKKRSSSDKSEDGNKEKRRSSNDDHRSDHRSEKERRSSRKDSLDNASNFDDKGDTVAQKKSGKHHRRDNKKDRKSRRSDETRSNEKDRSERRHHEKHSYHRNDRDVMDRNDMDVYRRAPADLAPGRNDAQYDRGRLDDHGPHPDQRRFDAPRGGGSGPIYGDYNANDRREGSVYGEYRSKDRHGGGGDQGHARRELDRSFGTDEYGPPGRRDRDGYGPPPQQRRDFGPPGPQSYGRDRDGPISRGEYRPPGGLSQRDARPQDDFPAGSRRDRDGDGPRGDIGMAGPRRGDQDGPFYGGGDPFYHRNGPSRGGDVGQSRPYRRNEGVSRDGPASRRNDRDR